MPALHRGQHERLDIMAIQTAHSREIAINNRVHTHRRILSMMRHASDTYRSRMVNNAASSFVLACASIDRATLHMFTLDLFHLVKSSGDYSPCNFSA